MNKNEETLAYYEAELVRVKEARIKALQKQKKLGVEEEREWQQEIDHLQKCVDLARDMQKGEK